MRLTATPVLGLLGLAAPLAAQQFTYDASILPNVTIWTDGVELADIDNDGDIDILFANGSSYGAGGFQPQHLYLNDGAGNFTAAHGQLNVANFNAKLVIAEDFDNDGDLDLMYAPEGPFPNTTQVPRMLINDGTGNFTDESATRLPQLTMASFSVCAGDVDDDGDLDVVFTNGATFGGVATQARLYLNDGDGFFTNATGTNMPNDTYNAQDVQLLDYDKDFDIDIALSGKGQNGKRGRLYLNDGTGNFVIDNAFNDLGTGSTYEIDYGDLDFDGDFDMFVQSISGVNEGIARNDGPGVIAPELTFPAPNGSDDNEMAGFDYDNDGDLDSLIGSLGGTERLYRNDGIGSWVNQNGLIQSQGDSTLDISVGDLNGDGAYDIVTAQGESGNWRNKAYINNGPADTTAPVLLNGETLATTAPSTRHHSTWQDSIQDDGQVDHYTVTYTAKSFNDVGGLPSVSNSSGDAYHQGTGTFLIEIPTSADAVGTCLAITAEGGGAVTEVFADIADHHSYAGGTVAGVSGVPSLGASGATDAGSTVTWTLTNAAPNSPGSFVLGVSILNLPLFGGTIVPNGDALIPFTTDGSGTASFPLDWPAGLPDCTAIWTQAVTLDFAAAQSFSISNTIQSTQN